MEKGLTMGVVFLALVLFGVGYNALVGWLEKHELERGYTAFLVAGGVLATLLAGGFVVGWESALYYLILFCASGGVMAIGSIWRHAEAEKRNRAYIERLAWEALNTQGALYAEGEDRRLPDEPGITASPERK